MRQPDNRNVPGQLTLSDKRRNNLSRDSATRGVSTTLMAPFTSTMAVVLV